MKKIWIVTEFFAPEETATAHILTKIANYICEDFEVNVVCGPSFYEKNAGFNSSNIADERINIFRVSDIKLDKNKFVTRTLRFLLLTWKLTLCLYRKVKKEDQVLIVTNPAPLIFLVSLIKKIKKFSLYVLVHDVFPENTIPARIFKSSKNLIYKSLKGIFNSAYNKADKLIVLGRDMKIAMSKKLGAKCPETVIIENWAEPDIICSTNDNVKINLQYAGNIGRVQGLAHFVDIFSSIGNDNLLLSFWGRGALEQKLKMQVEQNKISNVEFNGPYARKEQNDILNRADIALVSLAKGMSGFGVPSKTYNILASGHPILFIGDLDCEIALMVEENKIGYCFDPSDVDGIKNCLNSLTLNKKEELITMGEKARVLAETKYSEQVVLNKYKQLFK